MFETDGRKNLRKKPIAGRLKTTDLKQSVSQGKSGNGTILDDLKLTESLFDELN